MSETRKPFAGMYHPRTGELHSRAPDGACDRDGCLEVVVTPLLPGDPRPGEKWLWHGRGAVIAGAPFNSGEARLVPVRWDDGLEGTVYIANLRRPPVLKTFRLAVNTLHNDGARSMWTEVLAESKEAALAKLAESLEEVL